MLLQSQAWLEYQSSVKKQNSWFLFTFCHWINLFLFTFYRWFAWYPRPSCPLQTSKLTTILAPPLTTLWTTALPWWTSILTSCRRKICSRTHATSICRRWVRIQLVWRISAASALPRPTIRRSSRLWPEAARLILTLTWAQPCSARQLTWRSTARPKWAVWAARAALRALTECHPQALLIAGKMRFFRIFRIYFIDQFI